MFSARETVSPVRVYVELTGARRFLGISRTPVRGEFQSHTANTLSELACCDSAESLPAIARRDTSGGAVVDEALIDLRDLAALTLEHPDSFGGSCIVGISLDRYEFPANDLDD